MFVRGYVYLLEIVDSFHEIRFNLTTPTFGQVSNEFEPCIFTQNLVSHVYMNSGMNKGTYQAFFPILIDLIVTVLGSWSC